MRKYLALFLLLLPSALFGQAQGSFFSGTVQTQSGLRGGATVTVCSTAVIANSPTGATESGNTVTITTNSPHGFVAGQVVQITGITQTLYNGTFTILTVPTNSSFTYTNSNAGLSASGQGAVLPTNVPCTPTASIFSDIGLTAAKTNPITTDGLGNFSFYAVSGLYVYTVTGQGILASTGGPFTFQLPCIAGQTCVTTNGNNAFTGIDTACQLNGELYVGTGITCWAGSDIGAQINTAIAALPAIGGTIHPIPGITYNFSTPIVGATVGKYIRIVCAMDGATVLNYTPTTGAAITLAGGSGNLGGVQFENCTLTGAGSGNATTGLQIGTASVGVAWGLIKGNTINGFGTGISINSSPGNSYGLQFINNQIQSNGTGAALAGEGVSFIGGLIGNNATGVTCAAAAQVSFLQTSFDDNSTVAVNVSNSNCRLTFNPGHFENAGGGTEFYLTQSAGFTSFFGADGFQSDTAGGTAAQFATVSGGHIEYQAAVCATATRTLTQMFNLSGSVNAILRPRIHVSTVCSATGLATIFNAAYTGGLVIADAEVAGSNANTGLSAIKGSIPQLPDLIGTEGSGVTWRIRENAGNLDFFNGSSVAVRGSLLAGGGWVPGAAAVGDLGSTSLPWANLWIGQSTNNVKVTATTTAARIHTLPDATGTLLVSGNGDGTHAIKNQSVRFSGVLGGTCPTAAAIGAACTSGNINWTTSFGDNSYAVVCTLNGSLTGQPHIVGTTYQVGGVGITITIAADTAAAANVAAAGFTHCIAVHD